MGGTLAAYAAASPTEVAAQPSTKEDYWELVRQQFSFTENAVPMNAANLCPSFRRVGEQVAWYTADIDVDCSFNNRAKFSDMLETARGRVASQLGVSTDEVALVRNTTEANSIINNGFDLRAGDEVVIWDQNHQTNNVAWDVRAARFGFTVKRVATPARPSNRQQLIDTFVNALGPNTRLLSITHVSNVSGAKLPVTEIAAAAKQRGIYVHLDGAQTWGAMAVDLKDLGVDSYSASAHKWYMGPKEVGLLYVSESNIDRIWPSAAAPGWGDGAETSLVGARKFESLGQRDDAALVGLGVAAEIHDQLGPARIEARIKELAQRLKQGIAGHGHSLITPLDPDLSFGVCITEVSRGNRGELVNRLYSEFGIAGAGTGGIRLCPTIYNTVEHIDRAIAAAHSVLS